MVAMTKALLICLALTSCYAYGDNEPSDARSVADAQDSQTHAGHPGCAMALPDSRDITINTGDPIPPGLINKLQDMSAGRKFKGTWFPYSGAAFQLHAGQVGTFSGEVWLYGSPGIRVSASPCIPLGSEIISATAFYEATGNAGDVYHFELVLVDAATGAITPIATSTVTGGGAPGVVSQLGPILPSGGNFQIPDPDAIVTLNQWSTLAFTFSSTTASGTAIFLGGAIKAGRS